MDLVSGQMRVLHLVLLRLEHVPNLKVVGNGQDPLQKEIFFTVPLVSVYPLI
jgi:hypothetical protein